MEVIEANLATGMGNVRKILEVAIPEVKGVGGECLFMRRLVSEKSIAVRYPGEVAEFCAWGLMQNKGASP